MGRPASEVSNQGPTVPPRLEPRHSLQANPLFCRRLLVENSIVEGLQSSITQQLTGAPHRKGSAFRFLLRSVANRPHAQQSSGPMRWLHSHGVSPMLRCLADTAGGAILRGWQIVLRPAVLVCGRDAMEEDLTLSEIAQQLAGLAAVLRALADKPLFDPVANDDEPDDGDPDLASYAGSTA